MADYLTTIRLAGTRFGFAERGKLGAEEMITKARAYAHRLREEADVIDAAFDDEFKIYSHTGVHVLKNVNVLQEGRKT